MLGLDRAINPVVVAPTVTAVGLAFFAYGFPVVGTCVEIGIPQFVVVLFLALVSDYRHIFSWSLCKKMLVILYFK